MLTLRLARVGKKNHPQFRMVVQEKKQHPQAGNLDVIGYYHPIEKKCVFQEEKIHEYVKKGAKPSSSLARLLQRNGVKGLEGFIVQKKPKAKKSEDK